jgi:hypothetical protein
MTPEEIRLLQEENRLLREGRALQQESYDISVRVVESLKEVLGIRTRQTTFDQNLLNTNKKIADAILNQKTGLSSVKDITNQIKKNKELILKADLQNKAILSTLTRDERTKLKITEKSLQSVEKLAAKEAKMLQSAAEGKKISAAKLARLQTQIAAEEVILSTNVESLSTQARQLLYSKTNTNELKKQLTLREKELVIQEKLDESLGAAGKLTEFLGKIPGVGNAAREALAKVTKTLQEAKENGQGTFSKVDSLRLLGNELFTSLKKGLTDPLVLGLAVAGTLVKKMFDLNNQLVETGRALGYAKTQMTGLTTELNVAAIASGEFLATNVDLLKTIQQATDQLGVQGDILGSKNVVGATVLRDQLGLSAEEAINLAANSSIAGQNVQVIADQAYNAVDAFNLQNKTALNARNILRETANVSKDLGARFAFNTSEIAKAVTEAKNLGLTLGEISGVANNLLQFESSITAELEAELLTGKDLTLEKARQLALNNDLGGLAKELEAQSVSTLEYSKMNRFQQEAIAKAVGMTSEQLGKSLYQQELNNLSAEQFKAIYGEQNYEAAKQVSIQQRLEKAITKVADALTPVLELIASAASNAGLLYGVIGLIGAVSLARTIGSLVIMASTLASGAVGAAGLASALTLGITAVAIVGGIAAITSALSSANNSAQSVQDGTVGPGKGPFTITDKFGATAITDARDGIAVSPNIKRTAEGDKNASPTIRRASEEPKTPTIDFLPMISELKAVKDVLGQILSKEGTLKIDSSKAGTAFNMGRSKTQ